MYLISKTLAVALVLVFLAHPIAHADHLTARLDMTVRAELAHGFAGAVLVTRGEQTLLADGYGAERGVPVTLTSKFWIASLGKQFVAAAILKCAEQGKLTLDDSIARFFPEAPADKRAITIRQLLAHLSGFDQSYDAEEASDRAHVVAAIFAVPLIDKPGAKFHYANNNYELLAAIVEVASGDDYHHFVANELWRPAGLADTGFSGTPGAKDVLPARGETPARLSTATWGEAGVYATAQGLNVWYRALRAGRVLSNASIETLFAPVAPIGEGQAALGWFIGKSARGAATIFTRGNEDFGPNGLIYAYPASDTLIVVLTHASQATEDLSWSRAIQQKLETALQL